MDALQYGRIFLRSHGDCFIHATDHWLKYWNASASREQLLIVRVTLANECVFISTLSPAAIPYAHTQRGVSRRRYLEVDPKFAAELGISQDTEVGVESVREVEHCLELTIAPVNLADYDKLEQFLEKIDYELAEKIRVVSCQSFSFPIWIDNVVIPVKVVNSEPSAKWVLIVPGRTQLHIVREATSTHSTTLSALSSSTTPGRSPSQGSDEHSTENEEGANSVQAGCIPKSTWDFTHTASNSKRHQRYSRHSSTTHSSASTSPDADSDGMNLSITSLLNFGKKYFFSQPTPAQLPPPLPLPPPPGASMGQGPPSPISGDHSLRSSSVHSSQQNNSDSGIALAHLGSTIQSRGGVVSSQPQPPPPVRKSSDGIQQSATWGGRVLPPVLEGKPHVQYRSQPANLLGELKKQTRHRRQPLADATREGRQTPDVYPSKSSDSDTAGGGDGGSQAPKPSHRRFNTWHSETEFAKDQQSKDVSPSRMSPLSLDVVLRVQAHPLSGIKLRHQWPNAPSQGCWNFARLFDVFVHPSTIPEIHLYRQISPGESLLVELKPVIAMSSQQQDRSKESAPRKAEAAVEELASSVSADISDLSQQSWEQSDGKSESVFAKSLVVRLCFATNIVCKENGIHPHISDDLRGFKSEERGPGGGERGGEGSGCGTIVQPGHVVLSDYVRQQLGVRSCSSVKLLHVRENLRIPYAPSKPAIVLQPVGRARMPHQSDEVLDAFKYWVEEVANVADVGAILVHKQIVPLAVGLPEWVACRVSLRGYQIRPSYSRFTPYLLLTPHDVEQPRVEVKVQLRPQRQDQQQQQQPPPPLPPLGKPYHHQKDGSSLEEVRLPDISLLNLPEITLSHSHFGAFDELLNEGAAYIRAVFSQPCRSGFLLVAGVASSGGAGCGKTSLARLLCETASHHPYYASVSVLECVTLRGQSAHRARKRLKTLFAEAISQQPSVVLLDDLDHAMPMVSDVQDQLGEEGNASISKAQALLTLMLDVRARGCNILVMATAQSRQQLNSTLLQSRGEHIFEKCLEIKPPGLVDRKAILEAILFARGLPSLCDADLRTVALRTEGFQAGDLVSLTDRAVHFSQLRSFNPNWNSSHIKQEFPSTLELRNQMDFSPDVSASEALCSSPPLVTPPSISPRKGLHSALELKRSGDSFTPVPHRKKISILSSDSAATLIPERFQKSLSMSGLILEDFRCALEGFVPLSLRGLPLHTAGTINFSCIGGLEEAKQTLTETLLWPSKFPTLFSQCPIKQRCGVLLYGAPGTGKTLLAAAVAKEFSLNFISIKGPELLSKYIGQSEQAVRDVFTRAQSAKPCILFFDEFDSLAPRRGHDNTGVTDRVVNQLLTQLDGVEVLHGVYVLAASSRPDLIDPALLRPGRIDRSIFCDIPEESTRVKILKVLGRDILDASVNLAEVAAGTKGFTGADLKALLYNAQLLTAHEALDRKSKMEQLASSKSSSSGGGEGAESGYSSERGNTFARAFVFEQTASGLRKPVPSAQQTKTVQLHQKLMRQRHSSFITLREESSLLSSMTHGKHSLISHAQLLAALEGAKLSVSVDDRKKFEKIYDRFTGKTKVSTADVSEKTTMS